MKDEVRDGFVAFTARFEGTVTWMYLDVKGLVTTAVGCLIDSPSAACAAAWIWPSSGRVATPGDVSAEWYRVKSLQALAPRGGGAFAACTNLRLTAAGVDSLVAGRMVIDEKHLAARYAGWEEFPWQVQMALLSMAWAAGPASKWPRFDEALARGDWEACAIECHLDDRGNPGLRPRNVANAALFQALAEPVVTADNPPVFALPDEAIESRRI